MTPCLLFRLYLLFFVNLLQEKYNTIQYNTNANKTFLVYKKTSVDCLHVNEGKIRQNQSGRHEAAAEIMLQVRRHERTDGRTGGRTGFPKKRRPFPKFEKYS